MQQITVNLEDSEMALLKAVASDKKVQPSEVLRDRIKDALTKLAAECDTRKNAFDQTLETYGHDVTMYSAVPYSQKSRQRLNFGGRIKLPIYGEAPRPNFLDVVILEEAAALTGIQKHADLLRKMTAPASLSASVMYLYTAQAQQHNLAKAGSEQVSDAAAEAALVARRASRRAALQRSQGIWKGAPGESTDGVKIQEEMRAEWQ